MSRIPAANNLTIDLDSSRWRLFNEQNNGQSGAQPIVEASPDGLNYGQTFAAARRLSLDGHLAAANILMVVVGWAAEDSSWHLGVLLNPELAEVRGGRWCGLARWDNIDGDEAERAGQALSQTLQKPFQLVPPPDTDLSDTETSDTDAVTAETGAAEAVTDSVAGTPTAIPIEAAPVLLPLPITMGSWLLKEDPVGLRWEHTQGWHNETLLRAIFFCVITPIFGVLSIGAMVSLYAPVQPQWLPLIGLALTVIMAVSAINQIATLIRAQTTLIDHRLSLLKQTAHFRKTLQSPFEGLEYVLVSHVVNQRQRKSESESHELIGGEAWIHIYSPRRGFILIGYTDSIEGQRLIGSTLKTRAPLNLREIETPAHHVGLLMAQEIGIPAYAEER